MRAAVVTGPGGPDVIKLRDIRTSELMPGFARVAISYAAVNAADMWTRRPGIVESYPHIPGSDGAGHLVDANGPIDVPIGARVLVNPALQLATGERHYEDPFRDIVDILGYSTPGTCAEYCDVPIENIYQVPEHLSLKQAAAIPLTFLTAWRMLHTRGQLRVGEKALIWGTSGGLGLAGSILARHLGGHVVATAGSSADEEALRSLGFDVVRYDHDDLSGQVARASGGQVDLIFDSVAGSQWTNSLQTLRPGGRVVLAGTTGGDEVTHDLSDFFYYQWALLGCRMGDERDFSQMIRAVSSGLLAPVVGLTFRLEELSAAHEAFEGGSVFGKILVNVAGE